MSAMEQLRIEGGAELPAGFAYRADLVSAAEERDLVEQISALPFAEIRIRGQVARRRIVHFGWLYGYESHRIEPGPPLPAFLLPVRVRAAELAGVAPDALAEILVTEYPAGAGIGWHRDAPGFGDVIGISLAGACRMRFRRVTEPGARGAEGRRAGGTTRDAARTTIDARSAYVLRGPARWQWQHSIPPVASVRYSITFRTVDLLSRRTTGG